MLTLKQTLIKGLTHNLCSYAHFNINNSVNHTIRQMEEHLQKAVLSIYDGDQVTGLQMMGLNYVLGFRTITNKRTSLSNSSILTMANMYGVLINSMISLPPTRIPPKNDFEPYLSVGTTESNNHIRFEIRSTDEFIDFLFNKYNSEIKNGNIPKSSMFKSSVDDYEGFTRMCFLYDPKK